MKQITIFFLKTSNIIVRIYIKYTYHLCDSSRFTTGSRWEWPNRIRVLSLIGRFWLVYSSYLLSNKCSVDLYGGIVPPSSRCCRFGMLMNMSSSLFIRYYSSGRNGKISSFWLKFALCHLSTHLYWYNYLWTISASLGTSLQGCCTCLGSSPV